VNGFQHALDNYLAQNHGNRFTSGRLTPRQRRRLRHKYPREWNLRAFELGGQGRDLHGDVRFYARRGWY
jgi:hypothetical protein